MSKLTGIKKIREKTARFGSSAAAFVRRRKIVTAVIFLLFAAAVLLLLGRMPGVGKETIANPIEKLKESGKVIIKTGISGDEEKNTSLTRRDSLEIMRKAAEEMKRRTQREIQGLPFVLADKETLLTFLPAVKGWEMQEAQYHRGGYGGQETSNLNTKYVDSAAKVIEVELIDYSAVPAALQPLKLIFNMERSEEDKTRNEKVSIYNGVPVREEYNSRTKLAQFSAILEKRYIVTLKCRGSGCRKTLQGFMPGFLGAGAPSR